MISIRLDDCLVVAARADLVKSRVRLVMEVQLDAKALAAKGKLAMLAVEKLPVTVEITSQQATLFDVHVVPLATEGEAG